jgi:hypothetical protein
VPDAADHQIAEQGMKHGRKGVPGQPAAGKNGLPEQAKEQEQVSRADVLVLSFVERTAYYQLSRIDRGRR